METPHGGIPRASTPRKRALRAAGALVNEPPYCANLFNMRDAPLGFHHHALEGKPDGFPVWIDINLSEDEAQRWYTHLEEGLMLDVLTREMTADLVTYNAELRMFSSVFVRFRFTDGGSIAVTYKLHTIRVELYSEMRDYVRLGLELVFAACVLTTAVYQLKARRPSVCLAGQSRGSGSGMRPSTACAASSRAKAQAQERVLQGKRRSARARAGHLQGVGRDAAAARVFLVRLDVGGPLLDGAHDHV